MFLVVVYFAALVFVEATLAQVFGGGSGAAGSQVGTVCWIGELVVVAAIVAVVCTVKGPEELNMD